MSKLKAVMPTFALILAMSCPAVSAVAQEPCRFVLGFAALRDLVGAEKVGQCLENEYFNLENGNAEQHTTGGLMVWRKVDNFTAFTDGATSWINGPNGLQSRPNSERFAWEGDPVQAPSAVSSSQPSASQPNQPVPVPSSSQPAQPASRPATPTPSPTPALASTSRDFRGRGRQTTETTELRAGLVVARSTHRGANNFIVKLVDSSGKESDLLANTIGNSSSVRAGRVETSGRYSLNVTADGDWTVRVEQPTPVDVSTLPRTFTGKGDDVTQWIQLPQGRIVANSRMMSGRNNFIVRVIEQDGKQGDLLANEVGVSTGSKAFEGRSRVVLLSVQGDGDWSIQLTP